MTLRKNTTEMSVKYFPQGEQTREIKENTIKNKSTPKKNIAQTIKNSLLMWQHKELVPLKE